MRRWAEFDSTASKKPRGGMDQREAASVCHSETTLLFDLASDTCSSTPEVSLVDMVDINSKSSNWPQHYRFCACSSLQKHLQYLTGIFPSRHVDTAGKTKANVNTKGAVKYCKLYLTVIHKERRWFHSRAGFITWCGPAHRTDVPRRRWSNSTRFIQLLLPWNPTSKILTYSSVSRS